MRREGSPWQGLGAVTLKELSDHLTSWRMLVLEWLVVFTALISVYLAIRQITGDGPGAIAEDPYLFLKLFTRGTPLSFVELLSFLVPLVAIGLGFDLINSEHNQRTLSRVLSQPIYRDALLFGKFLAGLATIAISLLALWLLVIGIGILMMGVPPGGEEMARAFVFLLVTIAYAGVWLALAMLFSILFRSAATAALVALGLWLFLNILWGLALPLIASAITPSGDVFALLDNQLMLARVSPSALFNDIVAVLLDPSIRSIQQESQRSLLAAMGLIMIERGAIPDAPIPLLQSVLVVWGQIVGLVAGAILLFVAGYVVFQRQEVRA